nr:unnamed protein product [Spirometra erinaceieuropaei]
MFRQLLYLILACGTLGQGARSEFTVKENSDYVFATLVDCDYMYTAVDGVNISGPAQGSHCVPPNDCWEIVESKRVLLAEGRMIREHAAFVVKPMDSNNRSPITFQYKTYGATDSPVLNVETGFVIVKEVHKNEHFLDVVLFNADIGNITAVGDLAGSGMILQELSTISRRGVLREKAIIITGHLATMPRRMEVKCQNVPISRILINPSNDTSVMMRMLTFIDYVNAFKLN